VNGRQLGRASFQVSGPRAFGRRASSAAGRLRVDGGKVYLDSVLISTPDGYATASGMVTTAGIIDLDVSGVGLTAQDLTGPSKSSLTAGILNADGTVTGSFGNPVFTGRIQALDAVWAGRGIDEINGTITASRDSVSTTGLTVAKSASEAIITGTINNPLSDARSLDIAADVKSVDLTDVAKALPALDGVSGRMSGRVSSIQGRLDSLKASFALTVEEGRYHAYSAPLISVKGDYDQGDVNLESLSVKRGTANLTAQGAMSRTGALDFSFAVSDFPFDDSLLLALNRSIPVSGMLDASGHLTGTRESPTLEATLSGKDLNAAGEQLALTDSTVVLTQNVLTVTGASLTVGGGPLTVDNIRISTAGDDIGLISAAITIGSGGADSTGRVDVARLLAMVRGLGVVTDMIDPRWRPTALQLPEHIQGKLSGTVTVGTSPGGYLTSANLQVTGLQTWGANLGTVTLAASTGPQGTIVDTLTLEDNDMLVTAKGRLDANGALTADVEGNNVDVVRIPAVQAFQSASGRVDFSFEAKGTLTDPLVEGSILARDAEISGVRIDRFSTGQITATKDSITIAESTVGSGANRIRFAGSLPFSITRMAFVDGGAMDVHAEAINPNLDVLALLTNRINIDRTEGDGQAELNVTGTWPTPQLEGFIRVADGRVAIKGMQTEFEKVKVDIGFDGQRINIQEFSAESSHGGKLSITGGAKMGDQGWSADMAARTENMGIRLRNVSEVYQETFNGEMDLDLGVSGPLMKPLIAGKIVAHTGSLGLPTIPKTMTPHKPVAFDPSFDIALVAGKDLKARSPRLNVDIAGQIQLAQSLNNPLVTGQLQV
ncbi:MAG: translocation/assembly module TamB domain-containing protein, partial [Armatimonadota bacterium]